jgi:hypothetical protein
MSINDELRISAGNIVIFIFIGDLRGLKYWQRELPFIFPCAAGQATWHFRKAYSSNLFLRLPTRVECKRADLKAWALIIYS